MWILSFLPDGMLLFIINTVLLLGAIGSFLSFFLLHKILNKFPALASYHLLMQVVSAILLVAGIYLRGGYSVEMEWRERVRIAEAKVATVEEHSIEINKQLEEERKKKQKVKVEYYTTVKTQIKEVERQINADCKLDPKVNELINKAATNPEKAK
jgi:uncharacterized membrane protein YeaQ/YmgE (transglycosylase-associated protein family)